MADRVGLITRVVISQTEFTAHQPVFDQKQADALSLRNRPIRCLPHIRPVAACTRWRLAPVSWSDRPQGERAELARLCKRCAEINKTVLVEQLVTVGTHYFLLRARRFGKSLLVDTIKEMFEDSEELFEGLVIHPR